MNTLTVTKTIFRKGKRHNRTILSKETKEYELKTIDGNCRKADAIFNTIKPYEIFNDKDENISKYDFVKVNSISINFSTLSYDDTYYPSEHKIDRDGFEIFNTHIDSVVMLECYTHDNKIIRLDFQGHTDASGNGYYTYFDYNINSWNHYKNDEKTTKILVKAIAQEEDNIIELSASPLYDNPKNAFDKNSKLVPKGDFVYMLEFFSVDLVDSEEDKYQGCFSHNDLNGRYIKDAMDLIQSVEQKAEYIKQKYKNKGVEVTIGDFNEGCQYGMAIYVWIPYQ